MKTNVKSFKKLFAIAISIVLLLSFTACSSIAVSDKFDADEVRHAGEVAVDLINEGKTADAYENFDSVLKESLTAEEFVKAVDGVREGLGDFKSYTSAVVGTKDPNTNEDYASCVISAKYDKGNLEYSITYNDKLEIVGIYVK